MSLRGSLIPTEALVSLRQRLALLSARDPARKETLAASCALYGVSRATMYRALRGDRLVKAVHRTDRGRPRVADGAEVERWCEIVAALKRGTTNRKGRHLSTARILKILEDYGVHTPDGHSTLPAGLFTISTLNRHMRRLGYDQAKMTREPPAVRFQAEHANDLWHFDMSPSDLKHLPSIPAWVSLEGGGTPIMMLFSVVDDRSGTAYLEYRCVHGEDAESALGFLFCAMTAKPDGSTNLLQGIPKMLYLDNGPVAKSGVFQRVMQCLGIDCQTHMLARSDGTRTTARSKGKVERPFRTVKEAHEALYHYHMPETEAEANQWLARFVDRENLRDHRHENHSRIADWFANQPPYGIRAMCSWERFCSFAREPERRKVDVDARVKALKRLVELVQDGGGQLAVVMIGHPWLKNDLRRPDMEEVGDRTEIFEFGGLRDRQRDFLDWLLSQALEDGVAASEIISEEALGMLAAKLKTPLQLSRYLIRAFEAGFGMGAKPLDATVVDGVLSCRLDDLEPQLNRHGYDIKTLCEQFDAKPAEIRKLLKGELQGERAGELVDEMRTAGLPV